MDEAAIFAQLTAAGVVAVLVIDREEDGPPVAEALMAGGVTAMELTLRTPAAIGALRAIRREVPEMLAGIGTILTPTQVATVVEAGGAFGVSPGLNPRVVEAALAAHLPFAPGICTPSDIERGLEYDRRFVKFFPAEASGGLKYLHNIAAPYAHLGVRYMPLGGVGQGNMGAYLADPHVAAIGGSWLAPREAIRDRRWGDITEASRAAIAQRAFVRRPAPDATL
ncbi:MAG: bifunctional 4-hydroxy-2-oxoglutarate aldolase/2-dehydro-3-deoxy-phosphogluconate aldolase [Verrucomicrobiales bacterium]